MFFGNLESLRGLAALSVVVVHSLGAFKSTMLATGFSAIALSYFWDAFNGRNAVVLFFVLSGFVLCESLRAGSLSTRLFCAFMVRRAFRIVPVAYAALIPAALYLFLFSGANGQAVGSAADWFVRGLQRPTAASLIASFVFISNQVIVVYWTLHVELLGSLMFLPLLAVSRKGGWILGGVLVLAFLTISYQYAAQTRWVHVFWLPLNPAFLTFFFCFHLGILVNWLRHAADRTIGSVCARIDIAIAVLGVWVLCYAHSTIGTWLTEVAPVSYKRDAVDIVLEAFGSCLVVYGCSGQQNRVVDFILGGKAMRYLGRLSFGIYAIHIVVLKAIFVLLVLHLSTRTGFPLLAPLLALAAVVPVSVALAHLVHVTVERPGIQLGREIIRRSRWLAQDELVAGQALNRPGAAV